MKCIQAEYVQATTSVLSLPKCCSVQACKEWLVGTVSGYSRDLSSCNEESVIVELSLSAQIQIALHSSRVEILSALQQFTVCIELIMHLKSSAAVRVLPDSSAFCTPLALTAKSTPMFTDCVCLPTNGLLNSTIVQKHTR